MRYADYYDCDICNGNSVGMSLFVQGCPFHCKGCFNPETWEYDGGREWNSTTEEKFLKLVGRDYIKRVSFLGGSPLCDENVTEVIALMQKIKALYPNKQIWVYTGYKWEKLIVNPRNSYDEHRLEALKFIDVLVDGLFEYDNKDLTLAFRGSTNQRIIDVKKSLEKNKTILWNKDAI